MVRIDPVALARRLMLARRGLGLTQVQLAEKAGKSPTTVSALESGKVARPHLGTILDLADALGVESEDLIGDDASPKELALLSPSEADQRRLQDYPFPWMARAFSDLLTSWKKTAEQGYSLEHCKAIASGTLDALDAVVPPLASAWEALADHEQRERNELRRELVELAREAYEHYEQNSVGGVDGRSRASVATGEAERHEEIREEIRRRTREIA